MKLKFYRVQEVEVELTRKPTQNEIKILEGKDDSLTMFDLESLVNYDNEEIISEDYSNNVHQYIGYNKVIDDNVL